uniref:Uncharacterized protein n=1 Tax=Chromulina nebulosa TaxID=96789 RepID=A0A7S0SUJ4_9STRA|mmetsp:Transcript_4071/g.3654  ORF Transcript_4071/g.3654 Transcript_4071/m.3654 type:complete len:110 (+) Transcript_4071:100-429(+)
MGSAASSYNNLESLNDDSKKASRKDQSNKEFYGISKKTPDSTSIIEALVNSQEEFEKRAYDKIEELREKDRKYCQFCCRQFDTIEECEKHSHIITVVKQDYNNIDINDY